MMWDWVRWGLGLFFATLLLPGPAVANCHMLQRKRKGRKCGLQPPRPQTSPTPLLLMEVTKPHLLPSAVVGVAGEEGLF